MMKSTLTLIFALCMAGQGVAQTLDIKAYQDADGMIRMQPDGTQADPYFAAKALLMAQRFGLDASEAANAFIQWGLRVQRPDGLIDRYCQRQPAVWESCRAADADDSMMALWLQVLYRHAPAQGFTPAMAASAASAERALSALRLPSGVYRIFQNQPVAYYMDNVEVLDAAHEIAALAAARGDSIAARRWAARERNLRGAIARVFRPARGSKLPQLVFPYQAGGSTFYPDRIGVPFGWLHAYPARATPAQWQAWHREHAGQWQRNAQADFPWGLVALVALDAGDTQTARCWAERYASWRQGKQWHVMEEAIWQAIMARPVERPVDCGGATQ